jgi:hypothetical protein
MSVKRPAHHDISTPGRRQLLVGVVTDTQWQVFCREFNEEFWGTTAANGMRVKERAWLIPRINEITKQHAAEPAAKLEAIGTFAPTPAWDRSTIRTRFRLLETRYYGKASYIPRCRRTLDGKAASPDPPKSDSTVTSCSQSSAIPPQLSTSSPPKANCPPDH